MVIGEEVSCASLVRIKFLSFLFFLIKLVVTGCFWGFGWHENLCPQLGESVVLLRS